ncbi:MAG: acyltransferase, partial [Prevotellaceae bacterium]|nr:acyltransferase [Prevotellaceae bacterium]
PDRKEQIKAVADAIDKHIHAHYRIYPINKIACDELMQTNYAADCSDSEKKQVKTYLETQLAKINMPNQLAECRHILLTMYANPFRNYLKAIENTI